MATHKKLTRSEAFAVGLWLDRNMTRHADGTATYNKPGMNDEAAAADIGLPGVTANHIGNVRREVFGNFPKASSRPIEDAEGLLADLSRQVAELDRHMRHMYNALGMAYPLEAGK